MGFCLMMMMMMMMMIAAVTSAIFQSVGNIQYSYVPILPHNWSTRLDSTRPK